MTGYTCYIRRTMPTRRHNNFLYILCIAVALTFATFWLYSEQTAVTYSVRRSVVDPSQNWPAKDPQQKLASDISINPSDRESIPDSLQKKPAEAMDQRTAPGNANDETADKQRAPTAQRLPADGSEAGDGGPKSDPVVTPTTNSRKLNVLMLIADDMRPEMGSYIDPVTRPAFYPKIHTPNLDKLTKSSLLLKRAYVQQALCAPSRTSFLTGRRPDTTRVYDVATYWRTAGGNFTSLPQYFKQQGYITTGVGKIFHELGGSFEYPLSWNHKLTADSSQWYEEGKLVWNIAEEPKLSKHPLMDMQIANKAIETLTNFAKKPRDKQRPFFLAVGFRRPHLPLLCPKKYFDFYPQKDIELPKNPYAPQDMPDIAWSNYLGVRNYGRVRELNIFGNINTTLPDDLTKDIRRAYYACVTFVDDLIGDILDTLEKLGLKNDTVVTFLGDHGYQLGEHGEWEKQTNFELANHAPLVLRVPGLTDKGVVSSALVEFVDLFPTLIEAAGLPPVPMCPEESRGTILCHEGLSLVPLLANPNRKWKNAAFSQYPRMNAEGEYIMGYSIKTDRFRYTEWIKIGLSADVLRPILKRDPSTRELYDHLLDPDENINRWTFKEYKDTVKDLHEIVQRGWVAALP